MSWITGCGRPDEMDDRSVFRYNEAEGITDLDPAFARNLEHMWVVDQLFDGLVEMGPDMRVRPAVAERWQVSDSGRTYTFHLRQDVLFHDDPVFPEGRGRIVRASDVRYSLERIRDPITASPGRWVLDPIRPGGSGIEVVDDRTLIIRLERPFAPFLSMLAMAYCNVVPEEAIAHYGPKWRRNPVGCGPFRLFHWKEGVKLVLQRNGRYYQRDDAGNSLPHLDALAISFIKDPNAELLGLLKGELDMISGADGGAVQELLDPLGNVAPRHADRIAQVRAPALATDYLGFLMEPHGPSGGDLVWLDRRIRKAISMAIDRDGLVRYVLHGIGTPAAGVIPPGLPGSSARTLPFDPEQARQLLAEAGYPNGRGLPILRLTTTASYLDLCEYVQHQLGRIGIDLQVDVVPLSTHKEGVANGEFEFFRKNWIADYPDAENFLLLFHSANCAPLGPNYTRTRSREFDDLYGQAMIAGDEPERTATYAAMDSLLNELVPAVFLLHPEVVRFVRKEVSGLVADPMNQLDLRRVRKGQPIR
ncbi:MAG: ABC transporter substrate-binding protein [Flavobacteriales bacterium]|nr:ABC transporter substrate-binding protein [Flavobacteriales bacterium]